MCPQDRPLCKDYKFGVKWGNCESATVNPTIGVAQPVQGYCRVEQHQQNAAANTTTNTTTNATTTTSYGSANDTTNATATTCSTTTSIHGTNAHHLAVTSNFARPTDFTLFNEQILQQVLANKNLIPEDIPLNAEDQASLIRVGKEFYVRCS